MALKDDYNPCDPLPADDVNSIVSAVNQNTHNLIELFLENYYAGKSTPYTGMFFDGLSDTTKMDLATELMFSDSASGQKFIALTNQADVDSFEEGQEVIIEDDVNGREVNEVDTKVVPVASDIDFPSVDFAYTNVSQTTDLGDGGTGRTIRTTGNGGASSNQAEGYIEDTLSGFTIGVPVLITFSVNWNRVSGGSGGSVLRHDLLIDTVQVASVTPPSAVSGTSLVSYLFTPTATSHAIRGRCRFTQVFSNDVFDHTFYDLQIGEYGLTMLNNLANSYTTADNGKVSRTTTLRTGSGFSSYIRPATGKLFDHYYSLKQLFQNTYIGARTWVTRTAPDKQLMALAPALAGTTIEVLGDQEDIYASGDIVDLSTPDNLVRERGLLSGVTFTGSVTSPTVDATAKYDSVVSGTAFNYSHTCAVGATLLIVNVFHGGGNVSNTVTYGGQAMTQVLSGSAGGGCGISTWKLLNPPSGTNTVSVTNGVTSNQFATSVSFLNSGDIGATQAVATTTLSPLNLNLTTLVDGSYVYAWKASGTSLLETFNPSGAQTIIYSQTGQNGDTPFETIDAGVKATAGLENFNWTWGANHDVRAHGVEILPLITGNTELELSAGVANAWTTSDYIERVCVRPELSIVPNGNEELLEAPVYEGTIVDFNASPIRMEDEYSLTPTANGEDAIVKLAIDRNRADQDVRAYPFGVTYNE